MKSIDRRVLALIFVAAGALSGVAAVVFHELIVISRGLLLENALQATGITRTVLLVLVPAATAAAVGYAVQRFAPSALGANLARVRRAYSEDVRHVDGRTALSTMLLTPLSLGSGAPLGPEGPTVVISSGLAVWFAQTLRLPRRVLRGMVPVGTAAGIAAIFRTPITGVVFALEELFGTSSRSILGGTLLAAVAAAVVQQAWGGTERILPATAATWTNAWEMLGFAAVGVGAGVVSGGVLRIATALRVRAKNLIPSVPLRFAIGGAAVGLLGVMSPTMLGVGYDTTSLLVRGGGNLLFDAQAFGTKALGFIIAASAGLLGGTFAPSLFIGASLGALIGEAGGMVFGARIDSAAYALTGMGAYFAGTLRAPIAAVLIVVELTNDYGLIVPLMLAVALSNSISHAIAPRTLEDDQLAHEGFRHVVERRDPLADLLARDVMSAGVVVFTPGTPIFEVVERTREGRHRIYPVVDDDRRLIGLLTGDDVARAVREQRLESTVGSHMRPPLIAARVDEPLHDLLGRMKATEVDRCVVLDHEGVVAGFVSPSDVVRARLSRHTDPGDETFR